MTAQRVDGRAAHLLDARSLLPLLPHMPQVDLRDVRNDFARFIEARRREPFATWQQAWNAFTGATPHQPGSITYRPHRCGTCRGRRFDTRNIARNLARTGHPAVCGDCGGTGSGQQTRQIARYATLPVTESGETNTP